MNYQIIILIVSFFIGLIVSLITIPILKKIKVGQIERKDGPQSHLSKQGTPTMGGIIMIVTLILMYLIEFFILKKQEFNISIKLLPLVLVSLGFGLIGMIDDFRKLVLKNTEGLKPAFKMLGLLIISVTYAVYLIKTIGTQTYLPIIKQYIECTLWIYIPFSIFVMLGTTNAVNLTDGIDGLDASVTTIIIATLTVIGIKLGIKEVVILGSIICGANIAFLIFNMHPAKIFMGDTGSLFLGGVIVSMALYLKMPLILIVIALIPVIETLSVMIQVVYFKKTGKRIFKMAPIHHHFELSGWNENKIVIIFSLVTLILCIIGMIII